MKPFIMETPMLRLYGGLYRYRGYWVVCVEKLQNLFEIDRPKYISLRLSTKPSPNAWKTNVRSAGSVLLLFNIEYRIKEETLGCFGDVWLRDNTPLGTLAPGKSATVYVTLYVHED